jgi:hypothetical protein
MAAFQNVTASLRRTEAELEKQLEAVRAAISALGAGGAKRGRPAGKRGPGRPKGSGKKKRRKLSPEGRARIAAAQKKRWAEKKAKEKK